MQESTQPLAMKWPNAMKNYPNVEREEDIRRPLAYNMTRLFVLVHRISLWTQSACNFLFTHHDHANII